MRTVIRLPVALLADLKREARRRGLATDEFAVQLPSRRRQAISFMLPCWGPKKLRGNSSRVFLFS
jgi:hypothetical protein